MKRNKKKTPEGRGKRLLLFVFKNAKFVVLINSQPCLRHEMRGTTTTSLICSTVLYNAYQQNKLSKL